MFLTTNSLPYLSSSGKKIDLYMRYVASKNQKAFMSDMKPVYQACNKDAAETALDEFEEKWGKTYPHSG